MITSMYTEDIIPAIVDKYDYFTKVEKVIADYFINNRTKSDFSIKVMKERLYVSEASLSRFAKKLGFRGYREFVYQYDKVFEEDKEVLSANTTLSIYNDILSRCPEYIDDTLIGNVAALFDQVGHILVVGIGSSGLAGEEMKRRFIRLGVAIDCIDQSDLMKMSSIFQDERSLVIGISVSGQKKEVIFTLKQAHKQKAKTVLISAGKNRYDFVDYKLRIPTMANLDNGNLISPQFPVLVIIDLLYSAYLNLNKNKVLLHKLTVETLEE